MEKAHEAGNNFPKLLLTVSELIAYRYIYHKKKDFTDLTYKTNNEYKLVKEFLNDYSVVTKPTFIPGRGFRHKTLAEELEVLIDNHICSCGNEDPDSKIYFELLKRIETQDFDKVYEMGKQAAINRHHLDLQKRVELHLEFAIVYDLWREINKKYRTRFAKPLQKIEMKDYPDFLKLLDDIGADEDDRMLIAIHRKDFFSHKVFTLLANEN